MATWAQLDQLKEAAGILWPAFGVWAYQEWERLNATYFGSELTPVGILWGLTPHGRSLGHYRPDDNTITLHTSLIAEDAGGGWATGQLLGRRYASDVLLHEMIHQSLHQRGVPTHGVSSHNNEGWCSEINRISPVLGVDVRALVVRQRRVDGKRQWLPEPGCLTRMELAQWPHSIRPAGYYEDAALRRFSGSES